LRAAGVKLVVPLVSQGELIGVLNLGARLSEQEYSGDDRRLLDNLAAHAAPAVRVAQLVRQQQAEARKRRSEGATLKELAQNYNVGIATISRLTSRVAGSDRGLRCCSARISTRS